MLSSKRSRKLTHKATVSQEVGDVRMYTMFISLEAPLPTGMASSTGPSPMKIMKRSLAIDWCPTSWKMHAAGRCLEKINWHRTEEDQWIGYDETGSFRGLVKKSTLVCLGIAGLSVACFSYWTLKPDDSAAVNTAQELRPIPGAPSAGSGAQEAMQTPLAPVSKQTYELPSTHAVGATFENSRPDGTDTANDRSAERSPARAP